MQSRAGDSTMLSSPKMEMKRWGESGIIDYAKNKIAIPETPEEIPTAIAVKTANEKTSKDLWFIKGEYYDLTPFIPSHPGGTTILEMSRGLDDATPVMESYHAFANHEYINKTLAKYKVDYVPKDAGIRSKTEVTYLFENDGFYATLTRRVREHFGTTKENESITKNVKANKWWVFKTVAQAILFISFYSIAFLIRNVPEIIAVAAAAAAGSLLIGVGMNAMHDASHYAVGVRDSWKNKLALRIWNAIAYWDPSLWMYHHTVLHHAYTGDGKLDPDTVHATPAVRKHLLVDRNQYWLSNHFPRLLGLQRWFWALFSVSVYIFTPGMYVGQILSYHIVWPIVGELWNMSYYRTKGVFEKFWWERAITLFMIGTHFYKMDPLVTIVYFLASNLTYAACIVPDHDTYDSAILNHLDVGKVDWGEIQVRHASDFGGQGFLGRSFTEFFGCINVQIAHHLYPSLNHVFLPEIVPIIEQTCKEFNIPYARQGTVLEAIWSFIKTVHRCNGPEDQVEKME